jgi:hypothetical protein
LAAPDKWEIANSTEQTILLHLSATTPINQQPYHKPTNNTQQHDLILIFISYDNHLYCCCRCRKCVVKGKRRQGTIPFQPTANKDSIVHPSYRSSGAVVFEMSGQARAGRGNPRGRPPNSKKQQTIIPAYFLQNAGQALRLPQDQLSEVQWPANVHQLLAADRRSDRPPKADGDKKPPALSTSEVNLRQNFWKSLAKWFDNQLFVAPGAASAGVPAYTLDQWRSVLRSARSLRGKRETRAANHEKLFRGFPEIWQASQKKEQNPTADQSRTRRAS